MAKKKVKKSLHPLILVAIVGLIAGMVGALIIDNLPESQDDLIQDFYDVETATSVSPHHVRKHMADQDVVIVDLRSEEEYIEEHIIGAVNVPAYASRYKSAYGDVERITDAFKTIRDNNPDKDIIVYCYSIPCMTGRKIGKMLADNGIYVKHLGVGWNEWRYHWTLWNHPHEWNTTNVEDFVHSGPEPGVPLGVDTSTSCPIAGEFGC